MTITINLFGSRVKITYAQNAHSLGIIDAVIDCMVYLDERSFLQIRPKKKSKIILLNLDTVLTMEILEYDNAETPQPETTDMEVV